jgi:hypothetical protein
MLTRFAVQYHVLGASVALVCAVAWIGCGLGSHAPEGTSSEAVLLSSEDVALPATAPLKAADADNRTDRVPSLDPMDARPASVGPSASHPGVTEVRFAGEESAEGTKAVTFDDIKFEMKKDEKFKQRMLTEKINGLFDKSIRIRGYILPSFKQTGLTQFVLVRDNMECCFGPGAALYDCIVVQMVDGHTANFSVRPVTVEGKFSFQKLEDPIDGALRAIYHLDGVSVK